MRKFPILEKDNKFHWTANRIIYSILIVIGLVLFAANRSADPLPKSIFRNILVSVFLGTWFFAYILKLINLGKAEAFKGNLKGHMVFQIDGISIQDKIFSLDQINDVEISNNDYYGRNIGNSRGDFGPALSNGSDNTIKIKLISGESMTWNFIQNDGNDMQQVKQELMNYHLKGKMQFSNLAFVLGDNSQKEKDILKDDIQKLFQEISIPQNSRP